MSDKPTVIEAISRVMEEVQSVSKDSRNTQQNFNFRGIDAVVNAVGPALRKHGVVVVPTGTEWEAERYATKSGTQMKGVTLTVSFRFYGPAGDFIDATATGESSDSGDKAMPKAHSVAYRTLLLQALCIPTDEPDPDEESHERAEVKAKPAPKRATTGAKINDAERVRLFTIATKHGLAEARVKELVREVAGVESTKDVPRAKYDALVAAVEAEGSVAA